MTSMLVLNAKQGRRKVITVGDGTQVTINISGRGRGRGEDLDGIAGCWGGWGGGSRGA